MKLTPAKTLAFWAFPAAAMLFAALASGSAAPWLFYALGALALSALSALFGPMAVNAMARSMGQRQALLVGSVAGWLVIAGALVIVDAVANHVVTWSRFPAIGLGFWPLAVWIFGTGETEGQRR